MLVEGFSIGFGYVLTHTLGEEGQLGHEQVSVAVVVVIPPPGHEGQLPGEL